MEAIDGVSRTAVVWAGGWSTGREVLDGVRRPRLTFCAPGCRGAEGVVGWSVEKRCRKRDGEVLSKEVDMRVSDVGEWIART